MNECDDIVSRRYSKLEENLHAVEPLYSAQHRNWIELDGKWSKWKLFELAKAHIEPAMRKQQDYLRNIEADKPASISGLCLTPAELSYRLGPFRTYCPVRCAYYFSSVASAHFCVTAAGTSRRASTRLSCRMSTLLWSTRASTITWRTGLHLMISLPTLRLELALHCKAHFSTYSLYSCTWAHRRARRRFVARPRK